MDREQIFKKILDSSFAVHSALGLGLYESAYEACLFFELKSAGLLVERQKSFPILYKDLVINDAYKVDLIVENQIIIELKSVPALVDVHFAQILTYMKFANCTLGLLVNFNERHLKDGIKRVVL